MVLMNVTHILLGSTAAILVAALILSYNAMRGGEAEEGRRASAETLMADNARLQAEIARLRNTDKVQGPVQSTNSSQGVSTEQVLELQEQNRLLKEQITAEAKKVEQAQAEIEVIVQREAGKQNKEQRRAELIAIATLMAQVSEVAQDQGIFVIVLDVKFPQQVKEGSELAIRRGTGIIGRLVVSRIDIDGNFFADPLPGSFPGGSVDVKVGDELIVPPR